MIMLKLTTDGVGDDFSLVLPRLEEGRRLGALVIEPLDPVIGELCTTKIKCSNEFDAKTNVRRFSKRLCRRCMQID